MYTKLFYLVLILIPTIACGGGGGGGSTTTPATSQSSEETATYLVEFKTSWSSTTHPDSFPSGAHFSPLIGLVHNSSVQIWNSGTTASAGIESMAESGATSLLSDEINQLIQQGNAKELIQGSGISSLPGSTSVTFTISKSQSLVSLVTMIAPSPDWFIGVNSLSLIENNDFVSSKTVDLQPYDAGSDSGTNYTSSDADTQPKEAIFEITGSPFQNGGSVSPLGSFTFTRQ